MYNFRIHSGRKLDWISCSLLCYYFLIIDAMFESIVNKLIAVVNSSVKLHLDNKVHTLNYFTYPSINIQLKKQTTLPLMYS